MNDDNMTASVTIGGGGVGGTLTGIDTNSLVYTTTNTVSIAPQGGIQYGQIAMDIISEDLLEKWIMNRVTIDHKVQEQELMKLKEVAPDYANEIKENLSKNATRDIIKKMTFTKKHDKDADVHHFIGRVWVFTEEELKTFITEVKNA